MAVPLLDAFGRPAFYQGGGGELYKSPQEEGTVLPRPNLSQDIATLLSRVKHRALLSDSRHIAVTFPIVQGAVQQKAQYVTQAGFTPHFYGKDKAWGRTAREALVQAHRVIDVRGPLYNWNLNQKIGCTNFDIEGGYFTVRGETDTGYPQIQWLEAHRIGCRWGATENEVTDGPYKGLRILNGIIYNAQGREVAYRVLGNTPEQDRDISALDMHHWAIPRWFSDGRPFPTIAYSILDWYDAKESRGFQRTKQKINSALTLVETNETGKAPVDPFGNRVGAPAAAAGQPVGTAAAPVEPIVRQLAGGLIRYVKSGQGKIESHGDNTPGTGWLDFDERIVAGAFIGMDWRAEMLNLTSPGGGALTRGFADQINTSIYGRWGDMVPHVYADEMYILRKLIKRGDIPDHPEWWKWAYVPPAEFTVDGGRSSKIDIENILAGTEAAKYVIGRYGLTEEEVLRAQAEGLKLREELESEYGLQRGSLGSPEKFLRMPRDPRYTDNPPNAPQQPAA